MSDEFFKWFIIGILISYVWCSLSTILTYFLGSKKSNSYEPFWLKMIVITWGILAGINDKK